MNGGRQPTEACPCDSAALSCKNADSPFRWERTEPICKTMKVSS